MKETTRSILRFFLPVFIYLALCIPARAGDLSSSRGRGPKFPLQEQIVSILNSSPTIDGIRVGIYAISLKSGKVLADLHGDELFIPASNQKLFTSAAALDRLQPDFSFPTIIYAKRAPDEGVISGHLYIKGFGDPFLVNEELWELARQIKANGVRKITGDLIFDDSYFAPEEEKTDRRRVESSSWYGAKSGALSINFNTITFLIRPASEAGQKPLIRWDPPTRSIQVINRAVTTSASPRKALSISRECNNGVNSFTFSGQISTRHPPLTVYRAIKAPSRYAAEVLKEILVQKGIEIEGEVKPGIVPDDAKEIYRHQSKPLASIIASLNKISNNFIAQQILKTMGAKIKGAPGTSEKGLAVIKDFLEEAGLGAEKFLAVDGCGLSKKNLTTPKKIVRLLAYMYKRCEYQPEYLASLSVAGVDGTTKTRMRDPNMHRRVRVKTGMLDGVSCLSGYVYSYRDEPIAFSILMNGNKNHLRVCKKIQDKIVGLLLDVK